MINSNNILQKLALESSIPAEEIPNIDLYMDQVIQLFDAKYGSTLRHDEEKVLTKTMINNYAKGKLFIPIKNKKYSKKHIMLINMIYQLKGALSISDIKATMDPINHRVEQDSIDLDTFYTNLIDRQLQNIDFITNQLELQQSDINQINTDEELKQIMLITSLASMSNAFRKAAEVLVDDLNDKNKKDGKK